jgi:hypothetical protein
MKSDLKQKMAGYLVKTRTLLSTLIGERMVEKDEVMEREQCIR